MATKKKSSGNNDVKTRPTSVDPIAFIDAVNSDATRKDCHELVALMKTITGKPARMWGHTIVGFGTYHYKYASGREGEMALTGFSPRSGSLVIYLGPGLDAPDLLAKLGKHKAGKGCLYVNKLDDVDRGVLRELIEKSVAEMRRRNA
jgi:hypothetical protein